MIKPTYTLAEVAAAPDCFLTLKRTAEVLGVSLKTLRRMIKAGSGPQVTQLSVRRLGIRQSHLTEWSAGKLLGRFKVTACDISSPQRTVGGLDKRLKKHANDRS